jgi:hypothetical protein
MRESSKLAQNVVQLRRHGRPSFRERIADVEQLLVIDDLKPLIVKVSHTERILMELLLKRNMLTREVAWGVLYDVRTSPILPIFFCATSTGNSRRRVGVY